ncbi:MAG: GNAT family N-acetyltransferase [Crocinitomicaceae bacterium]|nr:GNAT family N-acetyltransferase [Crocinitomicaceae bacterium]
MEYLSRNQINTEKWDKRIAASPIENIFCYSWYLDATSKNWGAFVEGDYESVFPVPYTNKLSVKSLYQPSFTRELDIFGDNIQWEELMIRFTKLFRSIHFRNRDKGIVPGGTERVHQQINLKEELNYSTNAKRLIKKASQQFKYIESDNVDQLVALFHETAFKKIDSISNEDLNRLTTLMNNALQNGHGQLIVVEQNGEMVAGGFFLKDKKRITYLKGAATNEAKKSGAMFGLIDHAIQSFMASYETFDFGGSDVENVANFYKKFGAEDRIYYNYLIDNLPNWFKSLRKIKP